MQEKEKQVQFENDKPEVVTYEGDPRVPLKQGAVQAKTGKELLTVPPRQAARRPTTRRSVGGGVQNGNAPPRVARTVNAAVPRVTRNANAAAPRVAPRRQVDVANTPAINTRSQTSGPAQNTRAMKRAAGEQLMHAIERYTKTKQVYGQKPMQALRELASSVLDTETGKLLEYRHLRQDEKYKTAWNTSAANEFGRLAQGVGGRIKGTDTIAFVHKKDIPQDRFKDCTYGKFVCDVRPTKAEPNRTRLTVGGDRINYPEDVGTPTADMLLVKLLLNSVISTKGAKFMTGDIKNFYLNTPLTRYEYVRLRITDIPDEIVQQYKLKDKVTAEGYIYLEVRKGMYGLPQAGLLAQELLEKRLKKHGYTQSKLIPGFWTHKWRPIQFSLVVDDFGVKYQGKEHAKHLMNALKEDYEISEDWEGEKYIGLTFDWDYDGGEVHISMPGYVAKALNQFQHEKPKRRQDSPYPWTPPKYGAKVQYAEGEDESPHWARKKRDLFSR